MTDKQEKWESDMDREGKEIYVQKGYKEKRRSGIKI
jgi:hypothetical protein